MYLAQNLKKLILHIFKINGTLAFLCLCTALWLILGQIQKNF
jgi:hypothetical protein